MYTARMDPNPQESPDDARVLGDDPEAGRQEEVHSRPNSGSAHRGDGGDGQFADLYEPVIGSAHALESVRLRGIFAGPLQEMTRPPEQNVPPAPRTTTAPTSRSRSMASQISRTHRADSVSRAFRVSGSSSVIVATCDSTSRSTGTRSAFALSALGGSPVLHPSASTSTGKITGEPERDGSARPPPVPGMISSPRWLTELNFTGFCGFLGCLPGRMRCCVRFGGRLVDPCRAGHPRRRRSRHPAGVRSQTWNRLRRRRWRSAPAVVGSRAFACRSQSSPRQRILEPSEPSVMTGSCRRTLSYDILSRNKLSNRWRD